MSVCPTAVTIKLYLRVEVGAVGSPQCVIVVPLLASRYSGGYRLHPHIPTPSAFQ